MRFWFVNHYALPPGASGGPTRHLGLSRALTTRGHEVVIVASLFDHYTRRNHHDIDADAAVENIDGVTYVWMRTPPYETTAGRMLNMVAFGAKAARWRGDLPVPDIVVGSSPHLLAAFAAQRIARRHGAPFVMEVRDIWPQSLIDLGDMTARHPAMRALRILERWLYRHADHIVTIPAGAPAHIIDAGGRPDAISVIPNGVDLTPAPMPLRERAPGAAFTVVYAGTVGLANGLGVVPPAAAILKHRSVTDVRIRIVGTGPKRAELLAAVAQYDVADIVSVEPAVPSSDVPRVLADADACLLVLAPSPVFRWGISPTKLFDYMAAARPIISVVDAPDDAAMIAGAGVRVPSGDPHALAGAIESLRDMGIDERRAMGLRGRRYAETHHSFDSIAVRYEDLGWRLLREKVGRVGRWT